MALFGPVSATAVRDMAFLAAAAYDDASLSLNPSAPGEPSKLGGTGWQALDADDLTTLSPSDFDTDGYYTSPFLGYSAAGFVAVRDDTLAIAFRGTDDLADLLGASLLQETYFDAFLPMVAAALAYASVPGNLIANVYVTGHSLGGSMAERFAAVFGEAQPQGPFNYSIATFGSPGTDIASDNPLSANAVQVTHTGDPVPFNSVTESENVHNGQPIPVDLRAVADSDTLLDLILRSTLGLQTEHDSSLYLQSVQDIAGSTLYELSSSDSKVVFLGNQADNTAIAGSNLFVFGRAGDDRLTGTSVRDLIDGGLDNDEIDGLAGDDALAGAQGSDKLFGGTGNDTLDGGDQDDQVSGGNDNDSLLGGLGNDILAGGAGNDTIDGGSGNDTMAGNAGKDVYIVDSADDSVVEFSNQGTDEVRTTLTSYLLGSNVENVTFIGSGDFTGTGNSAGNRVLGGTGNDMLGGGSGNDSLGGGAGNDKLTGGSGNDAVDGGSGNDVLNGGNDNDRLAGGSGNDGIDGGAGDDIIVGGLGDDILKGGLGRDTLDYDSISDRGSGAEQILGFVTGAVGDIIDLSDLLDTFTGYDGSNAFSGGYLAFAVSGSDTVVEVDADGGGNGFLTLVTLTSTLLTETDGTNYLT